jgi:hypothetical protein
MRNRELDTRTWRLEVRDHEHRPCFHLIFVELDPLLAQPPIAPQKSTVDG